MTRVRIGFVMGGSGAQFTGGDLVVYRLALSLSKCAKITIFRMKDWTMGVPASDEVERRLLLAARPRMTRILDRVGSHACLMRLLEATRMVAPLEMSLRPVREIETVYLSGAGPHTLTVDHLIATSWPTAFMVASAVGTFQRHHLIQNQEDDPSYSGRLSSMAKCSFELPLHKIVVNSTLASRFSAQGSVDVVTPGVDTRTFRSKVPLRMRRWPRIVFPVRVGLYKGTDRAVKAIELLKQRFPKLEAVGFGNILGLLPRLKNNPPWLRLLSNPTVYELVDLYNSAGLFMLPSTVEGFGLTALEAMACGCIVISTPTAGVQMFVVDGFNGRLSNGFEPMQLADTASSVMNFSEAIEVMASRAIATAASFTWERTLAEFMRSLHDERLLAEVKRVDVLLASHTSYPERGPALHEE